MKYELIKNSNVGAIIDPTPILGDIKDTFTVSFVLPEVGAYIALFRDEQGVEYRTVIKDGTVKVPKQLLAKEQRIGLTVCQITEDEILHSWECQTLKVGTFLSLRKTQWQITAEADDKEIYTRLAELERLHGSMQCAFAELKNDYINVDRQMMQRLKDGFVDLAKAYNDERATKIKLAEEVIRQGQIIAEMQKDIEALKNEQTI